MATARHDIDIFSPTAYLNDQKVAQDCKTLRAQGPVVWIDQPPYRPFWAVLTRDAIMDKERDGKTYPQMSFGVMGGDMQPQGHLQTLLRMLVYQQQPQAACDGPRWKVNRDFSLDVEASMGAGVIHGLKGLGHTLKRVEDPYMDFGAGQFIWRLSDDLELGYVAASDSRRDGLVAAY